jgi:hypothetical protein
MREPATGVLMHLKGLQLEARSLQPLFHGSILPKQIPNPKQQPLQLSHFVLKAPLFAVKIPHLEQIRKMAVWNSVWKL